MARVSFVTADGSEERAPIGAGDAVTLMVVEHGQHLTSDNELGPAPPAPAEPERQPEPVRPEIRAAVKTESERWHPTEEELRLAQEEAANLRAAPSAPPPQPVAPQPAAEATQPEESFAPEPPDWLDRMRFAKSRSDWIVVRAEQLVTCGLSTVAAMQRAELEAGDRSISLPRGWL